MPGLDCSAKSTFLRAGVAPNGVLNVLSRESWRALRATGSVTGGAAPGLTNVLGPIVSTGRLSAPSKPTLS
jgi:hypothetical protein